MSDLPGPCNFAVIVPMANEEEGFNTFVESLTSVMDSTGSGRVYIVLDQSSGKPTLELCKDLEQKDPRFSVAWADEGRNVVDAYIHGYKTALQGGHDYIIEMDAGMAHDPKALPLFLTKLAGGSECVFGSRFVEGGAMVDANFKRKFLSRFGTFLANILLGSKLKDMTSGYQGFHRKIVDQFCAYPLQSKGHFYQTELRYLLRNKRCCEVPIVYRVNSPNVSQSSLKNALSSLFYYTLKRLSGKAPQL